MADHTHTQDDKLDTTSESVTWPDDLDYQTPLDDIEEIVAIEDDSDMHVYGLNMKKEGRGGNSVVPPQRTVLIAIASCFLAVLVLGHFILGFPASFQTQSPAQDSQKEDSEQSDDAQSSVDAGESAAAEGENEGGGEAPAVEEPSADSEQEIVEQQHEGLSQADLAQLACDLSFDGTDLSVPSEEVRVEVSQGNVQVSHTPGGQVSSGTVITANAAQQAAALCNELRDQWVQGDGEGEASLFEGVTWIVCNESGEAYLAVRFDAGNAPTAGDGLSVLAQASSYRLSGSVYYGSGEMASQTAGEAMHYVTGEEIVPAAEIMY